MKLNSLSGAAAEPERFRHFLQAEIARRCARNPSYSLRACAKFLDLHPATLSQLVRGKRAMTARTIRRLGLRLGLTSEQVGEYERREEMASPHDTPPAALRQLEELTRDTGALIAEWQHYAILELTRLESFRPDTRWIARVLDLTPDEVNIALQRLMRLGLLRMESRERWVDCSGDTSARLEDFAEAAVRFYTERARRLASSAAGAPDALRELSSTTLAVDSSRLPEAIALLQRARAEVIALLERGGTKDDVYQLELGLTPVTTLHRDRSS
jgi:uncharacterized protein (TIGR02147 family)